MQLIATSNRDTHWLIVNVHFVGRVLLKSCLSLSFIWSGIGSFANAAISNDQLNTAAPVAAIDFKQFNIEKYQLMNGLTVLLHPDRTAPIVTYHQWYRVGAVDESPGRRGLAHLFEHLMFKATTTKPEGFFEQVVTSQGGQFNAFTTQDYTGYYINLPAGAEGLAIELESDRMRNLILNEEVLKREREVVKEERRLRYDNHPMGALQLAIPQAVFKVHPYRFPTIGFMSDLNATSVADLKAFYDQFYAPNNAVVIVAGHFDVDEVKATIAKAYEKLQPAKLPTRKFPAEPVQVAQRRVVLKKNVASPTLAIAYQGVAADHPDSEALEVLAQIVGQGSSSRLYKRLIKKEESALGAGAFAQPGRYAGNLLFYAILKDMKSLERARTSLFAEVWRMRTEVVAEQELRKARNQVLRSVVDNLKSVSSRAQSLILNEIYFGDYQRAFEDVSKYLKVSAADLQRVAGLYLTPEKASVIELIPNGDESP